MVACMTAPTPEKIAKPTSPIDENGEVDDPNFEAEFQEILKRYCIYENGWDKEMCGHLKD